MADIRWKQRLQNFDRAFVLLRSGLESKALEAFTDLEREGLIQRFEYTYELAWKTLDFQTFTSILEAVVKRYFPALDAVHEWLLARSVQS